MNGRSQRGTIARYVIDPFSRKASLQTQCGKRPRYRLFRDPERQNLTIAGQVALRADYTRIARLKLKSKPFHRATWWYSSSLKGNSPPSPLSSPDKNITNPYTHSIP
jgi:hypothetical protein